MIQEIIPTLAIYFVGNFAAKTLQGLYFSILGFDGTDAKTPKLAKWIKESDSIFTLPLGKCADCNLFWCKVLFLLILALLPISHYVGHQFLYLLLPVLGLYFSETLAIKYLPKQNNP